MTNRGELSRARVEPGAKPELSLGQNDFCFLVDSRACDFASQNQKFSLPSIPWSPLAIAINVEPMSISTNQETKTNEDCTLSINLFIFVAMFGKHKPTGGPLEANPENVVKTLFTERPSFDRVLFQSQ